jgi:hypothetical protein
MADYSKKIQGDNKHLANFTSSRFVHIDGTASKVTVRNQAGRVMWITIFTKGLAFSIKNGTEVLGNVATTTAEGTYWLGEYCNTNITIDGISGTGSANVSYDV